MLNALLSQTQPPEPTPVPAVDPVAAEAELRTRAYWGMREYWLQQGRCPCGSALTAQQVAARGLCTRCSQAESARVERLKQHGLG